MKIGLNLLYLIPGEVGGTETYALSLIYALSKIDQENTYYIYLNIESTVLDIPIVNNFIPVFCRVKATNRIHRFLWEQLILPFQVFFQRLDILHSLGYIAPFALSRRSVVTIHDLNYLAIPQAFTSFTRIVQQVFVMVSARRANKIIAVSEFTKNEIIKYLDIEPNKIEVTLEAPKPRQLDVPGSEQACIDFLRQLGVHKPFMLAFSSLAPHKNIGRLVDAFKLANTALNQTWMLVIVGHLPAQQSTIEDIRKQGVSDTHIKITGFLTDEQVLFLYQLADLFVFPSLYEGFGLPVLEAMQCGAPVACSNRGSLPEVAGDAAVYFDPTDVMDISNVIGGLMNDAARRDRLRQRGDQQVEEFSWERTAQKTLNIYRQAYDHKHRAQ